LGPKLGSQMQLQLLKIEYFFEKFLHRICIIEANSRCVLGLAGNPAQFASQDVGQRVSNLRRLG